MNASAINCRIDDSRTATIVIKISEQGGVLVNTARERKGDEGEGGEKGE